MAADQSLTTKTDCKWRDKEPSEGGCKYCDKLLAWNLRRRGAGANGVTNFWHEICGGGKWLRAAWGVQMA